MIEETKPEHAKARHGWMTIPVVLFVLYALSGWPMGFLIGMCQQNDLSWAADVLRLVRKPHFIIAYRSEAYYDLLLQGLVTGSGDKSGGYMNWHQYRYATDYPDR